MCYADGTPSTKRHSCLYMSFCFAMFTYIHCTVDIYTGNTCMFCIHIGISPVTFPSFNVGLMTFIFGPDYYNSFKYRKENEMKSSRRSL